MDLEYSDHLQEALTHLEKAKKSLRKTSNISTLDIDNIKLLVDEVVLVKKDMIAVMATQGKVTLVAEHFKMTTGRIYQIRTEYLKYQIR